MDFLQLLNRKKDLTGQNLYEVNETIIDLLNNLKSQEIIVISVISHNTQINNQLISKFLDQGNLTHNQKQFQGIQVYSQITNSNDNKYMFMSFVYDSNIVMDKEIDEQAANLFLVYLISSLTIFPISNQDDLKQMIALNQKLQQANIQKIQKILQKTGPKLLIVQNQDQTNLVPQQDLLTDLVQSQVDLNSIIQFGSLFKSKLLLKTSFSSLDLQSIGLLIKLKPKRIRSLSMNGEILLEMILNFIENLNNTQSYVQKGSFTQIEGSQGRKKLDKVKKEYHIQIQDLTSRSKIQGKILLDEELLDLKHRELFQKILNLFDEQMNNLSNSPQLNKDRKDLINKICNDYENLTDKNYEESREFCSELMHSYQQIFRQESSNLEDLIENKDIYIKEKSGNFEEIMQGYLGDAVGPFRYRTVADNIPSFLFEMFDQWFEGVNSYYMSELNKGKANLMQTQETLSRLQITFSDSESKRYEIENQYYSTFYDLENQKREVDKVNKLKQIQEEVSEQRLSELKKKYENQKEKKKDIKEKYERQQNEMRSITMDLQEKKKELTSYLLKIDQLEKALEETISKNQKRNSTDSVGGLQEELLSFLKQFKDNLLQAEDQIKKSRESLTHDQSRGSMNLNTDRTYQKLMESHEKQIEKLQKKHKELKEKNAKISDEKEDIEKRNHELENLVNELENKFKYIEKSQVEKQMHQINDDLQKDESDILKKTTQAQQDFLKVLQAQKQQQESMSNLYQDMEYKFIDQTCKVTDLTTQKLHLITILREVIKMMQNKQHTLYIIINSLPVDTQLEIKDILKNAGIKQKNN